MAVAERRGEVLMTAEELFRRPDLNPCELVDGRVVPMSPTGYRHGEIESDIVVALKEYGRRTGRGRIAAGEVGIVIRRDPDTVRAADVLYISHERYARRGPSGYLDVAPELVVEVLSPEDRWSEVTAKVADYFSMGVERVWLADPMRRCLFTYRSPTEAVELREGDVLTDEDLLPGFTLPLDELFGTAQ